jgi:glycosyltransferase involved in cell wall biosynthesis
MIAHLRRSAAAPRPQVVVDGVIFQLQRKNPYGISRMWRSLLTEIGRGPLAEQVVLLDREGAAPPIAGIRTRRVPSFRLGNAPAEAEFLDAVCREERAGLFLSTYYTGTRETPSLLMLYDMIPESADAVGPNAGSPEWRDKHWAIRNAGAFAAISQATASGLKRYYPERAEPPPAVIPLAVSDAFRPRAPEEIAALRQADGPDRPYFLWVGRRDPHKNADLFFKAFARLPERERYAIVFAGGAGALEPAWSELAGGAPVYTGFFPDEKLAWLYAGALALVYPSRGEGFGLPLLEAMRSGCPVITCHNSSLFEIARSAALYVDEEDPADLAQRLMDVQQAEVRRYLIAAGHAEARRYSWRRSAALLTAAIESRLQARICRSDSSQTIGGH